MERSRTQFKATSARARALLKRDEDLDVEFKESVSGLGSDDIVAFANSERGGTILVGVRQRRDDAKPILVGCKTGDREKQKILDKASKCSPPIPISIYLENSSATPFYRVEIPAGTSKPYATSGGTYKTRDDGRVRGLLPNELMAVFLSTQAKEFRSRFEDATRRLVHSLAEMDDTVRNALAGLEWTLDLAESHADTASDNTHELATYAKEANERLLALLHHSEITDPVAETRNREELRRLALIELRAREDPMSIDPTQLQPRPPWDERLSADQFRAVIAQAQEEIKRERQNQPISARDGGAS